MASWDDEEFEAGDSTNNNSVDKWDGEDVDDDDLKDNWDDEEEEKAVDNVPQSQPKKKKTFQEKVDEREEKKRQELLAKQQEMAAAARELTPEEEIEEKILRQRLQEESDLELAKDTFGIEAELPEQKTIDNFKPTNKEEFFELSSMIVQKLATLEDLVDFPLFLETLIRDSCAGLETEAIKKISTTLNSLVQEKQKQAKASKGKKKTGGSSKKTLSTGKGMNNDDLDYGDGNYYNDFDDFM